MIGRGLDDVAGKPFGWAWHEERDAIRRHLRRRVWRFGFDRFAPMRLEARIDAIQRRIHRNRPSLRERQAALAASRPPYVPPVAFTAEELARIAEHFAGANDPVAVSIAAKAAQA